MTSTGALRVVGVSGSLSSPSRTTTLVEAILASIGRATDAVTHLISVSELAPQFVGALSRKNLPAEVEGELQRIETADLLVVSTPVYRASYTGLFKHVWDLVGQDALIDTRCC